MSDTKNKIIEEAFNLFIEKGFTDVSLNEVSESVGISKAGFYHYYKSKDELLDEVIKKYLFSYFDDIQIKITSSPGSPKDKIKLFILSSAELQNNIILRSNGERIDFRSFYLLILEGVKKFDILTERRLYFHYKMREIIKRIIDEGKMDGSISTKVNSDDMAEHIIICSEGIIMLEIINPNENIKQIADCSIEYIYKLISA